MSDTAIKIYFTRIKITSYNYKLSLSGVHQLLLEYKRQPSSGSSRYVSSLVLKVWRSLPCRSWILCFVTDFAGIPKTPEVSRLLGVGRSRGSWRCGEKLQGHSLFVRIQCLICHGRSSCGGGREVEVVVLQLVVLSMCSRNKQGVVAHH